MKKRHQRQKIEMANFLSPISKIIFKGDKIGWNLEQKIPQQSPSETKSLHLACLYAHNAFGFSHTLRPFIHCEEHRGQAFIEGGATSIIRWTPL